MTGKSEAGSNARSDDGSFVIESLAPERADPNGLKCNRGDRILCLSTKHGEQDSILGNLSDNEEAPLCIVATIDIVVHSNLPFQLMGWVHVLFPFILVHN